MARENTVERRFAESGRAKKGELQFSLSQLFSQQSPKAHNQLSGTNIKAARLFSWQLSAKSNGAPQMMTDYLIFMCAQRQLFTGRKRIIRAKWNANVKGFLRRPFANALDVNAVELWQIKNIAWAQTWRAPFIMEGVEAERKTNLSFLKELFSKNLFAT